MSLQANGFMFRLDAKKHLTKTFRCDKNICRTYWCYQSSWPGNPFERITVTGWRLKCRAFVFSSDSSDSSSIPNWLHWLPITTALLLRLAERIRIQVLGCASQEYKVVHNFMLKPSDIPTSPLLRCLPLFNLKMGDGIPHGDQTCIRYRKIMITLTVTIVPELVSGKICHQTV